MVDAAGMVRFITRPAAMENLHRINSARSSANFRAFNFNTDTFDLSPAAIQAANCGSTANEIKKEVDRGREMFFLLRLAFWLGLVLVLLPREKAPQMEKAPQIGAADAVQAATAAMSDMTQFCKRQPQACEVGGQAANLIGQRATGGAREIYRMVTDKKSPDHTNSIDIGADAAPSDTVSEGHDTLTTDDLVIKWRGPKPS